MTKEPGNKRRIGEFPSIEERIVRNRFATFSVEYGTFDTWNSM